MSAHPPQFERVAVACITREKGLCCLVRSEADWGWTPPSPPRADTRAPHLVLLFTEYESSADDRGRLWASATTIWPMTPVRVVELEGVDEGASRAAALLASAESGYLAELLPGRLLVAEKNDNDPLFPFEVNGSTRASWLGGRRQRLAEVRPHAPAGRDGSPPVWKYRSWRDGTEHELRLHQEVDTASRTLLDPLALLASGHVDAARWRCRLEQFLSIG